MSSNCTYVSKVVSRVFWTGVGVVLASSPGHAHQYSQALDAARQAAMIQTGANDIISKLTEYGLSRIEQVGIKEELTAASTIFLIVRNRELKCQVYGARLKFRTDSVILEIDI